MKWTIEFIREATSGKVLSSPQREFAHYCTDHRDPKIKGSLFIALVGSRHDAHTFVPKAVEAGARGILCHQWKQEWEPLKQKAGFIKVSDTLVALQDLASSWRDQIPAQVIALTGSNGKTTTKDFLHQILSQRGETQASQGSFNNHWGLPFTLLKTSTDSRYCILEMGMNHSGEIKILGGIARPDLVAVINVGRAHVGHFKDGVEGVARAKEEIYEFAPKEAKFVFNLDNPWTKKMFTKYKNHPRLVFSNQDPLADVYLKIRSKTQRGFIIEGQVGGVGGQAEVNFWGEQNLENLAAAACLAYGAGVDSQSLWQSFHHCRTGWGRNQWLPLESGGWALFDGYNANPDSFKSLLENLKTHWNSKKQYMAFFSEMLELGEQRALEHESLGRMVATLPWTHCVFMGPSGADFKRGWEFSKNKITPIILNSYEESLDLDLAFMLNPESQVIVKGSRGGALERIVERLNPVSFSLKSV